MQVIIDISQDIKEIIDKHVVEGKTYLLPVYILQKVEKAVKCGTPIPDNATNGDMIKAMFPNANISIYGNIVKVELDNIYVQEFHISWWNAPYKRGSEDGSN